jgi:hypothetical protein
MAGKLTTVAEAAAASEELLRNWRRETAAAGVGLLCIRPFMECCAVFLS